MATELGKGYFGSLRKRVAHEIKLHRKANRAMRRARYSLFERITRRILAGHSFSWFVGAYLVLALTVVLSTSALMLFGPWLLSGWSKGDLSGFLKDATSYLIIAQVGLLAVVSVAVGLVTLIAQRDDRSSTNTDIQLYYDGSLAYEVVASSVALLLILCAQIFWPLNLLEIIFGFDKADLLIKTVLTGVHVIWLSINVTVFGEFIAITLRFVEPKAREQLRERYTANSVVPNDLWNRLLQWLYLTGPKIILPASEEETGPVLAFGHGLAGSGDAEIITEFKHRSTLWDVRSRLLSIALRHWWRRTVKSPGYQSRRRPTFLLGRGISLALTPSFGREFEGATEWCRRTGGLPLTFWELWLIRRGFIFRKVRPPARDLPSPANFMEELADKVVGQIDRLASTGFKVALDEMIRYHRFLLEVYASRSAEGTPLSLAEIGGMWEQPRQE